MSWDSLRDGAPALLRHALIFGCAGMAPDLDLLVGAHRGPTHGLGAAVLAGGLSLLLAPMADSRPASPAQAHSRASPGRLLFACAVALAYASHTLLDWLGHDTTPPTGIMALWPISRAYYESSVHLFDAISRRYWLPGFWQHNLVAMTRELTIIVPILGAIYVLRRRPESGTSVLPRRSPYR